MRRPNKKEIVAQQESPKYFVDKEGNTHAHIFYNEVGFEFCGGKPKYAIGFYFENETYSDLYGPYLTIEECKQGLTTYCKEYLGV